MSKGPPGVLWRLIKTLLWFVVRLLVLALTGNWISRGDEERADEERGARDDAGLPPGASTWDLGDRTPTFDEAQPVEIGGRLDGLSARLTSLRSQAAELRRAGNVYEALDVMEEELADCRGELAGPDLALAARAQNADLAVGYLERSVRHRLRDPSTQAWLAAVDRVADDVTEPPVALLDSQGRDRHARAWVSALGQLTEGQHQALVQTPLGALPVERGLSAQPESWPALVPRVARSLLVDVPGLADELYRRHQLPVAVPLPHSHVGIGPEEIHGALGVWLETLFADIYACLRLGPAYARFLLRTFDDAAPSQRAHAAMAAGGWLSSIPPRSVRVHAVARVLDVLGQHREREAVWQAWTARHGAVESLFFPTADGTWTAIPAAYFFGLLEPVIGSLTVDPLQSLGGTAMVSVPDLQFGHADDASHQRLRELFAEGRSEPHAPYIALAAASRAAGEDGADRAEVARAAQRALGVPEALAGTVAGAASRVVEPPRRSRKGAAEPRSLARAVRSRRIQREALVLGQALAQRRRPAGPGRGRGGPRRIA